MLLDLNEESKPFIHTANSWNTATTAWFGLTWK